MAAVQEEEDLLQSLGVQGEMKNLVDIGQHCQTVSKQNKMLDTSDDDEGLKPLSRSNVDQMLLPESDRVMQEPVEYIEEDNQARGEVNTNTPTLHHIRPF